MSITDAAGHIKWTLERSPKAFAECRDILIDLRILLVNCELAYQQEQRDENPQ